MTETDSYTYNLKKQRMNFYYITNKSIILLVVPKGRFTREESGNEL